MSNFDAVRRCLPSIFLLTIILTNYASAVAQTLPTTDEPSITFHHINPGDPADAPGLAKWRTTALQSFSGLTWLFSGGHKAYHTLLPRDDSSTGWNMGPPNQTFRQIVTRFWEGGSPVRVIFGNP